MKTALSAMLVASVTTAAWASTCLPIINHDVTVDGIMVGAAIAGGGHVPPSCPTNKADIGWAGVPTPSMHTAATTPKSKKANFFMAAREAGGKISKLYFGVHVEGAPDFTIRDKITLYFQADGNKADWDVANDFALAFDGIGAAAATPLNRDGCSSPANQLRYYKRDPGNTTWMLQASVPAGITAKTSFDYETVHDPETEIWELEIGIDLSVLNPALNIVRGGKVGIGGKLYLFEASVEATTAFYFPETVAPNDPFLDVNPNQGGVSARTLEKATVGGCAFDVVISRINVTSALGNPATFTVLFEDRPTDFEPGTGNTRPDRQSQFTAIVTFVNSADANDTSPVAVANSGNVTFSILLREGGGMLLIPIATIGASFNQLKQSITTTFKWPMNRAQYREVPFFCCGEAHLVVDLTEFTVDFPGNNKADQQLVVDARK
jgi:hypothetical protein